MSNKTETSKRKRLSETENPTLEDVRPPDRVHGYPVNVPRWYTKFFELLPAVITYGTLASPFFFALIGTPEYFVF